MGDIKLMEKNDQTFIHSRNQPIPIRLRVFPPLMHDLLSRYFMQSGEFILTVSDSYEAAITIYKGRSNNLVEEHPAYGDNEKIVWLTRNRLPGVIRFAKQHGMAGVAHIESGIEAVCGVLRLVAGGAFAACPVCRTLDQAPDPYDQLSSREKLVLQGILQGLRNQDLSQRLHVAPQSVTEYTARLLKKLNCTHRADLFRWYQQRGMCL